MASPTVVVKLAKLFPLLTSLSVAFWSPVQADSFTVFNQPTDDGYLAQTALYPIAQADFTNISALDGPFGPIQFSLANQIRSVPNTWDTWNSPAATENATPRVVFSNNGNMLTLTFPQPFTTFGFEAEPENMAVFNISADFFRNGSLVGDISNNVDGNGGALLFAARTDVGFTSVTITTNDTGFALAELRAAVPEPSGLADITIVALAGLMMRRCATKRRGEL